MANQEEGFKERRSRGSNNSDSVYSGPERRSSRDYPADGLTPAERQYVRKMIEEDTRRKWLAKQTLSVVTWIAAILIGVTTVWDTLKNVIRAGGH